MLECIFILEFLGFRPAPLGTKPLQNLRLSSREHLQHRKVLELLHLVFSRYHGPRIRRRKWPKTWTCGNGRAIGGPIRLHFGQPFLWTEHPWVDPCLRWLQPGESEMGRVGGRVTPVSSLPARWGSLDFIRVAFSSSSSSSGTDLNQCQISVGTARPQLPAPALSGHCQDRC